MNMRICDFLTCRKAHERCSKETYLLTRATVTVGLIFNSPQEFIVLSLQVKSVSVYVA